MNNKFKNKVRRLSAGRQGFTILEMLVATAVFTIVMIMAMESLLNINSAQKKAESFREVSDNLNFTLDVMTREIRTGQSYLSDSTYIAFQNAALENIVYNTQGGQLMRSSDGGATFIPLTDIKIKIDYLNFALLGEAVGDSFQPLVRINLSASAGSEQKSASKINLQTSVSQLIPDS